MPARLGDSERQDWDGLQQGFDKRPAPSPHSRVGSPVTAVEELRSSDGRDGHRFLAQGPQQRLEPDGLSLGRDQD
jgi:hypothetical protein